MLGASMLLYPSGNRNPVFFHPHPPLPHLMLTPPQRAVNHQVDGLALVLPLAFPPACLQRECVPAGLPPCTKEDRCHPLEERPAVVQRAHAQMRFLSESRRGSSLLSPSSKPLCSILKLASNAPCAWRLQFSPQLALPWEGARGHFAIPPAARAGEKETTRKLGGSRFDPPGGSIIFQKCQV